MHNWLRWSGIWLSAWLLTTAVIGILYAVLATVGTVALVEVISTLFVIAVLDAVVLAGCVGLYGMDRQKASRVVGAGGVVLVLVIALGPVSPSGPDSSGPPYSGTVASEDPLQNQSESYTLSVDSGDRITIDFSDGARGYWSIGLPEPKQTISGRIPARKDYATVRKVTHDTGTFVYTANQSGSHEISISAEVYQSASYRISVAESG